MPADPLPPNVFTFFYHIELKQKAMSIWLAQLVKSFAAPTHVHSRVQEVLQVQSSEQTISTQDSISPGYTR